MAEYTSADVPWPIEEVYPRELRLGDVVKIAGNLPWLQITRIVDATAAQPEWERSLGSRAFVLSTIDEDRPRHGCLRQPQRPHGVAAQEGLGRRRQSLTTTGASPIPPIFSGSVVMRIVMEAFDRVR